MPVSATSLKKLVVAAVHGKQKQIPTIDTDAPPVALTDGNYFGDTASRSYFSASQFKSWMHCQAMWYHETIARDWTRPPSDALAVGTYTHLQLLEPEKVEAWIEEHPELISTRGATKGDLKAPFQVANVMVQSLHHQPACMTYLIGEHETIVSARIQGHWWKGKLDTIDREAGWFSDLKTTANLRPQRRFRNILPFEVDYHEQTFIHEFAYHYPMSLYQFMLGPRADGHPFEPFIVAATKQDPPNVELYQMGGDNQWMLDKALLKMVTSAPMMAQQRKTGQGLSRCGECAYCRSTKQVLFAVTI